MQRDNQKDSRYSNPDIKHGDERHSRGDKNFNRPNNNHHPNNNQRFNDDRNRNNTQNNNNRPNPPMRDHNGMSRDVNREFDRSYNNDKSDPYKMLPRETIGKMQNELDLAKYLSKAKKLSSKDPEWQSKWIKRIIEDENFQAFMCAPNYSSRKKDDISDAIFHIMSGLGSMGTVKSLKNYVYTTNKFNRTMAYIVDNAIDAGLYEYNNFVNDGMAESPTKIQKKAVAIGKFLQELQELVQSRFESETKRISKHSGFPVDCVRTFYIKTPEYKYGGLSKETFERMLDAIYGWIGNYGFNIDREPVNFTALFNPFYGAANLHRVAMYILLEDKGRIHAYEEMEYSNDVGIVWDALSAWALDLLENADDATRNQIINSYMNELARMNGITPRVDIIRVSNQFTKLANTLKRYESKFKDMLGKASTLVREYMPEPSELDPDYNKAMKEVEGVTDGAVEEAAKTLGVKQNDITPDSEEEESNDYNVPDVHRDDDED